MNKLETCFKEVGYDLEALLSYIDIGDIGLPDIQRPFVWPNAKVRDLFDSMYRGFPVGYLLFWENRNSDGVRPIGTSVKQHETATRLIIDGQQRLTSLYAVFRGEAVLDADYKARHIEIAFHPRDGKFDVADAAIRRDAEWVPNVSEMLRYSSSHKPITEFICQLSKKTELNDDDKEQIACHLERLFAIKKYHFTALEIASNVNEEQVADIFVRINSKGVKLNQADFILTLLSVSWGEGRAKLEEFCKASRIAPSPRAKPSPFNHFIRPDPDQLLRVAVALGFGRGRLKSVYQVLRGKDLNTGEFLAEQREKQFDRLKEAQAHVLKLTNWHQFLSALIGAGFRSDEMVSSQNALLFSYAFYLYGRVRFSVPENNLQKAIGRWYFASSLTGRYTSSPETVMDGDLARFREVNSADKFLQILDDIVAKELTNDFWTITLPVNLDSSSARNPGLFAYVAAQNKLGAPVLFSHKAISDLINPTIKAKKKPLERHHLFPRAWLKGEGIGNLRIINQMANYALLEWPDNLDISDAPPGDYVPRVRERFKNGDWRKMAELHALPDGWENMAYSDFLNKRRKLMADIIRRGFEKLQ